LTTDHHRRFRENGGCLSWVETVFRVRLSAHAAGLPRGLLLQPLGLPLQLLVRAENDVALEDRPAVDDGVLHRAGHKSLALDQRRTHFCANDLLTSEPACSSTASVPRAAVSAFLEQIRGQLKAGTYRPSEVRQVTMPKRNGKMRKLGIRPWPTGWSRERSSWCWSQYSRRTSSRARLGSSRLR
jgi:hypothetical protein